MVSHFLNELIWIRRRRRQQQVRTTLILCVFFVHWSAHIPRKNHVNENIRRVHLMSRVTMTKTMNNSLLPSCCLIFTKTLIMFNYSVIVIKTTSFRWRAPHTYSIFFSSSFFVFGLNENRYSLKSDNGISFCMKWNDFVVTFKWNQLHVRIPNALYIIRIFNHLQAFDT